MFIVTKLHLRQELKRARADRNRERAAILEQVLGDEDLLQLVHEANQAEYEYVREARAKSGLFGNPFQDFLAWLFENREAILAFILQIIQILSVLQPAPAK